MHAHDRRFAKEGRDLGTYYIDDVHTLADFHAGDLNRFMVSLSDGDEDCGMRVFLCEIFSEWTDGELDLFILYTGVR